MSNAKHCMLIQMSALAHNSTQPIYQHRIVCVQIKFVLTDSLCL